MAYIRKTTRHRFQFMAFPETFRKARLLRKDMTEAEKILWHEIRDRKIEGKKFRRQHPVGQFIVDFYCTEKQLIVELDGNIHREKKIREYDDNRTYELEKLGLRVIRFTNDEVCSNLIGVIQKIKSHLQ